LILLDQARMAQVRRVIYAGSSSAYGNQEGPWKRESDAPSPLSPYAAAKLSGEYYGQAFFHTYGLETVTLRYFNVFGPRQDPNSEYSAVIPRFVSAMLAGRPPIVYGDGKQSRDFTYVDNVVHGNLLAASANGVAGKSLNVACGHEVTLLELIDAINELLGTDFEPRFEPPRPGDVRSSRADITLARKVLGYHPLIDFKEGLRRSIDYYRSLLPRMGYPQA
jgi:UDP-glucose 4-epimerase